MEERIAVEYRDGHFFFKVEDLDGDLFDLDECSIAAIYGLVARSEESTELPGAVILLTASGYIRTKTEALTLVTALQALEALSVKAQGVGDE